MKNQNKNKKPFYKLIWFWTTIFLTTVSLVLLMIILRGLDKHEQLTRDYTSSDTNKKVLRKDSDGNIIFKTGESHKSKYGMMMSVLKFEKRDDIDVSELVYYPSEDDYAVVATIKITYPSSEDVGIAINLEDFTSYGGKIVDVSENILEGKETKIPSDITFFPQYIDPGETKKIKVLLVYNKQDMFLYNVAYGGADWQSKNKT